MLSSAQSPAWWHLLVIAALGRWKRLPWLHSESDASLGYMRQPHPSRNKNTIVYKAIKIVDLVEHGGKGRASD